jgi:hypothetical protein
MFAYILSGALGLFLLLMTLKKRNGKTLDKNFLKPIEQAGRSDQKELWLALMQVESADFTSDLYKETNNAIGMNCVKKRPTTQIGCTDPVWDGGMSKGIYDSLTECVEDLMLWADYTNFPRGSMDARSFVGSLDIRGYFGVNPMTYLEAINSWLK